VPRCSGYEGYCSLESFTPEKAWQSLLGTMNGFDIVLIQGLINSISAIGNQNIVLLIIILIVALYGISRRDLRFEIERRNTDLVLILLGLFTFILSLYPYFVMDRYPGYEDWSSRNQLLTPLGASLLLYYPAKVVLERGKINNILQALIFSLLIVLFINASIMGNIGFQKDWYKQLSLVDNFKESHVMRNNTTFLFLDNTSNLNANNRFYRFYEISGLMKYAFGDERRFGIIPREYMSQPIENFRMFFIHYYNLQDYKPKEIDYLITIDYGNTRLNRVSDILELMYLEYLDKNSFENNVKGITQLKFTRYNYSLTV
jgi:hypothetical protein